MEKTDIIKSEAEELVKKMIDDFEIQIEPEGEVYHVIIRTESGAPSVIGRHGETIRAIQKVLDVILFKRFGEAADVLVNVNDFREKQKEKLHDLASKFASKTEATHSPSYLHGLSSYERKIVHEYITQNYSNLTTYSTGDGRERQLVIDLKENAPEATQSE